MSGAEPWTGSNSEGNLRSGLRVADGARPRVEPSAEIFGLMALAVVAMVVTPKLDELVAECLNLGRDNVLQL